MTTQFPTALPRGQGRQHLRSLKRLARSGSDPSAPTGLKRQSQVSALALLDRSIKFGHRRLAILRLKEAVDLGALVGTDQWTYCEKVAAASTDGALRVRFEKAKKCLGQVTEGDRGSEGSSLEILCKPHSPVYC